MGFADYGSSIGFFNKTPTNHSGKVRPSQPQAYNMKKFLTLFPYTENVHLIKDVGMIPYVLHKEYGYESTIASFQNGEYPYLEDDVKGLKQTFIKKIFKKDKFNVYWFILTNFRK